MNKLELNSDINFGSEASEWNFGSEVEAELQAGRVAVSSGSEERGWWRDRVAKFPRYPEQWSSLSRDRGISV